MDSGIGGQCPQRRADVVRVAALYFKAPEAKNADEKAREKVRDDVYLYDENFKHTHVWKVTVASKRASAGKGCGCRRMLTA